MVQHCKHLSHFSWNLKPAFSFEKNWIIIFQQLPEGLAFGVEAEMAEPEASQGAVVFLAVVGCTIIIIYIVHLIMMVSGMIFFFYACVPALGQ